MPERRAAVRLSEGLEGPPGQSRDLAHLLKVLHPLQVLVILFPFVRVLEVLDVLFMQGLPLYNGNFLQWSRRSLIVLFARLESCFRHSFS